MTRIILLLIFIISAHGAIQMDKSCLDRPQACDDEAFSVSDFLICGGDAYGVDPVNGAKKGTGIKATGCGFSESCDKVYPADEINNGTWGVNPTVDSTITDAAGITTGTEGGCFKLRWDRAEKDELNTAEAALLTKKTEACQKWLKEGTAVCQTATWFKITLPLVIVLIIGGMLMFYVLNVKKKKVVNTENPTNSELKHRTIRMFDDGI